MLCKCCSCRTCRLIMVAAVKFGVRQLLRQLQLPMSVYHSDHNYKEACRISIHVRTNTSISKQLSHFSGEAQQAHLQIVVHRVPHQYPTRQHLPCSCLHLLKGLGTQHVLRGHSADTRAVVDNALLQALAVQLAAQVQNPECPGIQLCGISVPS